MMHNNLSTLGQQDFQARHSDMLAAARCEPLTKEQVVAIRFWRFVTRLINADAVAKSTEAATARVREYLERDDGNPYGD